MYFEHVDSHCTLGVRNAGGDKTVQGHQSGHRVKTGAALAAAGCAQIDHCLVKGKSADCHASIGRERVSEGNESVRGGGSIHIMASDTELRIGEPFGIDTFALRKAHGWCVANSL